MISAILLAAGQSKRMGRPKQLLLLDGSFMLQITYDNLRSSRVDEVVVVLGFMAEKILRTMSFQGANVVVNREYEEGMGSSLKAGLRMLSRESQGVLTVLGDQPTVRTSTLNAIMEKFLETKAGIVIPVYKGSRGNPVLISRKFYGEILKLRGDVGAKEVLRRHSEDVTEVEVSDPGILTDIDTPRDLQAHRRMVGK